MWLHVAFDLPTTTSPQRKAASVFRNQLIRGGFSRSQFSIYVMYLPRKSYAPPIIARVTADVPPGGKVSVLELTDNQWATATRFCAEEVVPDPEAPQQLEIF